MAILLLAAFIGVPLLEIAVFIQVGDRLGLWNTLAVVILTAIIGTWLLRIQGLATLARVRSQINQGALPTRELFDGLCLLFAGALLLTPGFVTDAFGFALFIPQIRGILRHWIGRKLELSMTATTMGPRPGDGMGNRPGGRGENPGNRTPGSRGGGDIIDGEFEDMTEKDRPEPEDPSDDGPKPPTGRLT